MREHLVPPVGPRRHHRISRGGEQPGQDAGPRLRRVPGQARHHVHIGDAVSRQVLAEPPIAVTEHHVTEHHRGQPGAGPRQAAGERQGAP